MKNLLDDIIMDKFDKIVSICVIVFSIVCAIIYYGDNLNTNKPKIEELFSTYETGKELLANLPEKEKNFNSSKIVYGYTSFLMNVSVEEMQIICSKDELELLDDIAISFDFGGYTTQEELDNMKDKSYAIQRFGLDSYTTIYQIAQSHKSK